MWLFRQQAAGLQQKLQNSKDTAQQLEEQCKSAQQQLQATKCVGISLCVASNLNNQSCNECGLAYCFFGPGVRSVDMKNVDAKHLFDL